MAVSILRIKQICAQLNVGKTKLDEDFVYHPGGDEFVPDTNETVHRLRLVKLGERSQAAFSDEVGTLIEELRAFRDAQHASASSKVPPSKPRPPGRSRKHPSATAAETSA